MRRWVRILREAEPAAVPVHLLHAGPQPLPLKLRAFLDYATPRPPAALGAAPVRAAGSLTALAGAR